MCFSCDQFAKALRFAPLQKPDNSQGNHTLPLCHCFLLSYLYPTITEQMMGENDENRSPIENRVIECVEGLC